MATRYLMVCINATAATNAVKWCKRRGIEASQSYDQLTVSMSDEQLDTYGDLLQKGYSRLCRCGADHGGLHAQKGSE